MAKKAGVAYPYLIICELCELCEQKCRLSIFSGKLRTRNSAKYKPLGCLIEAIANAAVERGSQCGQSNGDSIGSYPVLPTNNTRISANSCDITKTRAAANAAKAAKQRSGIQAAA